jgi:hypothetical protein
MKKIILIAFVTMLVTTILVGSVIADPGPAPNSGDGIPDGPGWE